MVNFDPKQDMQSLIDIINHHSDLYFNKSAPEISDYEFDLLVDKLRNLEKQYPEYLHPNSPTQRLGGGTNKNFKQVKHLFPMLSLGNTYSEEDIAAFYSRCCKILNVNSLEVFCELKCDGVAVSLIYENGILVNAITRGDGVSGDDITQNVLSIKSIPKRIHNCPQKIEVRGEIFMMRKQFEILNKQRSQDGEPLWANPRNLTSGTIKLLDSAEVSRRGLDFFPYTLIAEGQDLVSQEECLDTLREWGFHVFSASRLCVTQQEVIDFIDLWRVGRSTLPMDIDGIVIKVNDLYKQQILGATAHSPRWAVAYKYRPASAETKLLSVSYQVGRTGAVTPVADFAPVELAGTIIRRASLYNQNFLQNLDLHYGDTIFIEKGGDIIPKVTAVNLLKREKDSLAVQFPIYCPECGSVLVKNECEAIHYCTNHAQCLPQIKGKVAHFVSKNAMNISSIGPKTIDALFKKNLIANYTDLYKLAYNDIINLEGFKHQATENILRGIANSKSIPFSKLIYALGIRHVGEIAADILAKYFRNVDALMNASLEDLEMVKDIGGKTAMSVRDFFSDKDNLLQISQLKGYGVNVSLQDDFSVGGDNQLKGKSFVISGVFENFGRGELKQAIKNLGGTVVSAISKQTTYLVAGGKAGESKLSKAKDLQISIIDEGSIMAMIKGR